VVGGAGGAVHHVVIVVSGGGRATGLLGHSGHRAGLLGSVIQLLP
jgi:hypothetical protein